MWSHLGTSHRPALDVDTAAAPGAHETLVSLGAPGTAEHRRIVAGIKLEVIEVLDPGDELADLDEKSRLFLAGHWAAVEATVDREICSADLAAVVPVACRLPLIACKLHAWLDRRDQAARAARMIQIHTDATPPSADDVRTLGNLLLERL